MTNKPQTTDHATACNRYRESMTPMMLVRFEEKMKETFGDKPLSETDAKDAKLVFEQILIEG